MSQFSALQIEIPTSFSGTISFVSYLILSEFFYSSDFFILKRQTCFTSSITGFITTTDTQFLDNSVAPPTSKSRTRVDLNQKNSFYYILLTLITPSMSLCQKSRRIWVKGQNHILAQSWIISAWRHLKHDCLRATNTHTHTNSNTHTGTHTQAQIQTQTHTNKHI